MYQLAKSSLYKMYPLAKSSLTKLYQLAKSSLYKMYPLSPQVDQLGAASRSRSAPRRYPSWSILLLPRPFRTASVQKKCPTRVDPHHRVGDSRLASCARSGQLASDSRWARHAESRSRQASCEFRSRHGVRVLHFRPNFPTKMVGKSAASPTKMAGKLVQNYEKWHNSALALCTS